MTVDISKVLDLAILYNPILATRDIGTVYLWLNERCDIEMDMLPVMKEIMQRKKGITSFSYFTNPIRVSRDKRQLAEKMAAQVEKQPEMHYINIYRWKRSKGLPLTSEQEAMLAAYESNAGSPA